MLTKLFRPSGMALGIVIASLFLGTNVLAKDWRHDKHGRHIKAHSVTYKASTGRWSLQALQDQIAALQGDVEALKKLVEALQLDLQEQVGELSTELESVQTDMADLQSRIEANMGDVETMKAQLAEQETAAGVLKADLKALEDQIAVLELAKQNGILDSCPSGYAMQQVLPDGSVMCVGLGGGSSGGGKLAPTRATRMGPLYPGQPLTASVMCPAGSIVTGGGYLGTPQIQVNSSYSTDPSTWTVSAINTDVSAVALLRVDAYCASVE